ncbi:hypothetical protein NUW54_g7782 [Trametes sanguinea]|uniref:Uncharacterized protein n=1 Tax=Trametes sanguinea TaxID=158606 RepID=A0ACC1PKG3_9APHY|nr:hypothetical protein NUW54_g7782 [Trametes sanguinea]
MAAGVVNIRRDVDDKFYRYRMPLLMTKIEGKGNGIKTVIPNMSDVARALSRPPTYPTKFFGCELAVGGRAWSGAERRGEERHRERGWSWLWLLGGGCWNENVTMHYYTGVATASVRHRAWGHRRVVAGEGGRNARSAIALYEGNVMAVFRGLGADLARLYAHPAGSIRQPGKPPLRNLSSRRRAGPESTRLRHRCSLNLPSSHPIVARSSASPPLQAHSMSTKMEVDNDAMSPEPRWLDTVEGEIAFFRSLMRARPVGIHRHFHVLTMRNSILRDTGQLVADRRLEADGYELPGESPAGTPPLHVRSPSPSDNLSMHPFFRHEYTLPQDETLDSLVSARRMRASASLPSSSPAPSPSAPAKSGRGSGRKGKSKLKHMAGLVGGDSDSTTGTDAGTEYGEEEEDPRHSPGAFHPPSSLGKVRKAQDEVQEAPVDEEVRQLLATTTPAHGAASRWQWLPPTLPPPHLGSPQLGCKGTLRGPGSLNPPAGDLPPVEAGE